MNIDFSTNSRAAATLILATGLFVFSNLVRAEDLGTPAEQYAALLREYQPVSGGMREAVTDLERKVAVESLAPFPARFLDLAEEYPEDPVALKALRQAVQIVNSTDSGALTAWETNRSDFPAGSSDDLVARAVALLRRDHILSEQIEPVVDRVRFGYRLKHEEFLRAVLQSNPHRRIQAATCLSLARFLNDKLRMLRLAEARPELARHYETVFGEEFLPELKRRKQAGLAREVEGLFERAAVNYADVEFRGSGTVGEQAARELHEIRSLSIGKAAPEIQGKDQDGAEFKLSDYRGKVVLLYFWVEF